MVHAAQTRAEARAALIDRWDAERRADPAVSRMILTHLNKEVQMLNQAARERLVAQGELGENIAVRTERGIRSEEHTSELQSLMRISYAVFCLTKKSTYTNY